MADSGPQVEATGWDPPAPVSDGRSLRGARDYAGLHERLLVAAGDLLESETPGELKMPGLAAAAGCSLASVYNHFPRALDGIATELGARVMSRAADRYALEAPGLSGLDLPRLMTGAVADELLSHPRTTRFVMSASINLSVDDHWLESDAMDQLVGPFEAAAATVNLPASAQDLALYATTFFRGALNEWCIHSIDADTFASLAARSVDVAAAALGEGSDG
jgi:AcrR family transcriptional regulator